jgi:hydrogenase expression/formation protein HypE
MTGKGMDGKMTTSDGRVSLAHGNGGRFMRELIKEIFANSFGPGLNTDLDAAPMWKDEDGSEWVITTDGFTVEPLEFPGGNIGSLSVHGTINDLAVAGATPCFMTLNAFIEEGFEIATLKRIADSIGLAAAEANVSILAGDTKVVRRGQGGGLYLATTGVGRRDKGVSLGLNYIKTGDRIIVSGTIGDHGTAVLLAREQFGLSGRLESDAASVLPVTRKLLDIGGTKFMRDPTRGGLATVAQEIAAATSHTVRLFERSIPVRPEVRGICDILGFDPMYLACEGRVVAVVAEEISGDAIAALRSAGYRDASVAGQIENGAPRVILETRIGGERLLPELEDDPLPRIC